MKSDANSKTLALTLAATALAGMLFAGNANAMADPSHRYTMGHGGDVERTNDAQKPGMFFVGEPVGWIRIPGAAGAKRTVNLEGRVIEGRGLIVAPKSAN